MPTTSFAQTGGGGIQDGDTVQNLTIQNLTSIDMQVDSVTANTLIDTPLLTCQNLTSTDMEVDTVTANTAIDTPLLNSTDLATSEIKSLTTSGIQFSEAGTNPYVEGSLLVNKTLRVGTAAAGQKMAFNGSDAQETYVESAEPNVEDVSEPCIMIMNSGDSGTLYLGHSDTGDALNNDGVEAGAITFLFSSNQEEDNQTRQIARITADAYTYGNQTASFLSSTLYQANSRLNFYVENRANSEELTKPAATLIHENVNQSEGTSLFTVDRTNTAIVQRVLYLDADLNGGDIVNEQLPNTVPTTIICSSVNGGYNIGIELFSSLSSSIALVYKNVPITFIRGNIISSGSGNVTINFNGKNISGQSNVNLVLLNNYSSVTIMHDENQWFIINNNGATFQAIP